MVEYWKVGQGIYFVYVPTHFLQYFKGFRAVAWYFENAKKIAIQFVINKDRLKALQKDKDLEGKIKYLR